MEPVNPLSPSNNNNYIVISKSRFKRMIFRFLIRFVGPFFTVFGLILSIYQVWQANEQSIDAEKSTNQIKEILDKISTKNIGEFPNNFSKINTLLKNTTKSLYVLADVPAYGQFSSPNEFMDYRNWFTQNGISKNIEIKMITYNAQKRGLKIREQFSEENADDFKKWISKPEIIAKLTNYNQSIFPNDTLDSKKLSEEQFYKIIESVNEDFVKTIKNKTRIKYVEEVRNNFPLFIWIRDDEEAIFSFINFPSNTTEVSFQTVDKQLINVLKDIFDGAYKSCQRNNRNAAQNATVIK